MRPLAWAATVLRNRWGGVPRPSWCTYIVSYRCNARCQMCDSWQIEPGYEMTPDEAGAVFRKIGRLDVVRLTGGEPFLRTDLNEIAQRVLRESRPRVIHITTNGSFRKRAVALVKGFPRPDRLRFMISFDGVHETHDENRGPGVPYRRALETAQELANLRRSHGIEVSANHTVISPQSMEDSAALKRALGAIGVEVHSVLAYADSSMYTLTLQGRSADHMIVPVGYPLHPKLNGADAIGFTERELASVGEFRSGILRWGKRYYLRGLLERLRGKENPRPKPRCVALRSHIRLLPDGRVPVCQFNTQTVGDLRTQPFKAVWHNDDTRTARKWVDGCPGCWAECEVVPNAIYSGDILRG